MVCGPFITLGVAVGLGVGVAVGVGVVVAVELAERPGDTAGTGPSGEVGLRVGVDSG